MSKRTASPTPLPRAARTQPPPTASLAALYTDAVASIARFLELSDVARLLRASRGLLTALSKPCGLRFECLPTDAFTPRSAAARHVTHLHINYSVLGAEPAAAFTQLLHRVSCDMPWVTYMQLRTPPDFRAWQNALPRALEHLRMAGDADSTKYGLSFLLQPPRLRRVDLRFVFRAGDKDAHLRIAPLLHATGLREVTLGILSVEYQAALIASDKELPWTTLHFSVAFDTPLLCTGAALAARLPHLTDLDVPAACLADLPLCACVQLKHLRVHGMGAGDFGENAVRTLTTCVQLQTLDVRCDVSLAIDLSSCTWPRLERLLWWGVYPIGLRMTCPRLHTLRLLNTFMPLSADVVNTMLGFSALTHVECAGTWGHVPARMAQEAVLRPLRARVTGYWR